MLPGLVRTALYVPSDRPERFPKALASGAHAVILDLEDSVAPNKKEAARAEAGAYARSLDHPGTCEIWVRVNHDSTLIDIEATAAAAVTGFVIPKCDSVELLAEIDAALSRIEQSLGVAEGTTKLAPLIESATGVLAAPQLARCNRVTRLQLGEADLAADLGMSPGPDGAELLAIRTGIVVASAAARLQAPMGPVWTSIDDLDGLRRTTDALRTLGFGGRSVIHPKHVATVNGVFTPGEDELAAAAAMVARYDEATRNGSGAVRDESGAMMDEATVRAARRLLQEHGRA